MQVGRQVPRRFVGHTPLRGGELGTGSTATVVGAVSKGARRPGPQKGPPKGERVAVKIVDKRNFSAEEMEGLLVSGGLRISSSPIPSSVP